MTLRITNRAVTHRKQQYRATFASPEPNARCLALHVVHKHGQRTVDRETKTALEIIRRARAAPKEKT